MAESLGISSIEQSPELVASAVLNLLMGTTGQVVAAHARGMPPEHVLVEPRLIIR